MPDVIRHITLNDPAAEPARFARDFALVDTVVADTLADFTGGGRMHVLVPIAWTQRGPAPASESH